MPDINVINGLVNLVQEFGPHLHQEPLQTKEAEESWRKIKTYWESKDFKKFVEAYSCLAATCIQEHPEQVLFTPYILCANAVIKATELVEQGKINSDDFKSYVLSMGSYLDGVVKGTEFIEEWKTNLPNKIPL